jgi:hypothetical protein
MKLFAAFWLMTAMLGWPVRAESGSVYFKVITVAGDEDTWTGAFQVDDLSAAIDDPGAVALSTSFVGGLSSEPGFTFTSGSDIFVWQGDDESLGANSTIYSPDLVAALKAGITWRELYGQSYGLLSTPNTTDLSVLNPVFLRLSGQGGAIQFSNEPFPVFDPYTDWLTNYPGLTNTAKSADPDGDGFDNGTEFAFDGDPTVGTPALLTITTTASQAVITFVAHNSLFPDNYVVLSTTNLATAAFAPNAVATAAVEDSADQNGVLLNSTYTRKQFAVPVSFKEFFRVYALLP